MADNSLTAAELRAIGERLRNRDTTFPSQCEDDADKLYASLERLLDRAVYCYSADQWWLNLDANGAEQEPFLCKDDAIDALLQGGGE